MGGQWDSDPGAHANPNPERESTRGSGRAAPAAGSLAWGGPTRRQQQSDSEAPGDLRAWEGGAEARDQGRAPGLEGANLQEARCAQPHGAEAKNPEAHTQK